MPTVFVHTQSCQSPTHTEEALIGSLITVHRRLCCYSCSGGEGGGGGGVGGPGGVLAVIAMGIPGFHWRPRHAHLHRGRRRPVVPVRPVLADGCLRAGTRPLANLQCCSIWWGGVCFRGRRDRGRRSGPPTSPPTIVGSPLFPVTCDALFTVLVFRHLPRVTRESASRAQPPLSCRHASSLFNAHPGLVGEPISPRLVLPQPMRKHAKALK